jgi:glutathione peroxidase
VVHDFTVTRNDGTPVSLGDYKGKVLLMVNTASECGLTPQYTGLEQLHEKYAGQGLAVLGFPANEFGAQEPGSDAQIHDFCRTQYGVKFDLFAKSVVKGEGITPLYQHLTGPGAKFPGDIKWNFEKFLVDKQGNVVERFDPQTDPQAPEVVSAIERELAKA